MSTEKLPAVSLAIVEDDPATRAAWIKTVEGTVGWHLVWSAESVDAAIRLLEKNTPAVLLVDLGLPDGSGIEIIRRAKQLQSAAAIKVLVISVFGDERNVIGAIECGADGYLLKDASSEQVRVGIEEVLAGSAPISAAIAGHLLRRLRGPTTGQNAPAPTTRDRGFVDALTPREIEVLQYLAKGFSYRQVADLQQISVHTVGTHVKQIYQKLSVRSKNEAIFEAVQSGVITMGN